LLCPMAQQSWHAPSHVVVGKHVSSVFTPCFTFITNWAIILCMSSKRQTMYITILLI
jgi:hypothetical protein